MKDFRKVRRLCVAGKVKADVGGVPLVNYNRKIGGSEPFKIVDDYEF